MRSRALLCCLCVGLASAAAAELTLEFSGATFHVQLDAQEFQTGAPAVLDWVRRGEGIVSGYYGRFPAPDLRLRIQGEPGCAVRYMPMRLSTISQ